MDQYFPAAVAATAAAQPLAKTLTWQLCVLARTIVSPSPASLCHSFVVRMCEFDSFSLFVFWKPRPDKGLGLALTWSQNFFIFLFIFFGLWVALFPTFKWQLVGRATCLGHNLKLTGKCQCKTLTKCLPWNTNGNISLRPAELFTKFESNGV